MLREKWAAALSGSVSIAFCSTTCDLSTSLASCRNCTKRATTLSSQDAYQRIQYESLDAGREGVVRSLKVILCLCHCHSRLGEQSDTVAGGPTPRHVQYNITHYTAHPKQ